MKKGVGQLNRLDDFLHDLNLLHGALLHPLNVFFHNLRHGNVDKDALLGDEPQHLPFQKLRYWNIDDGLLVDPLRLSRFLGENGVFARRAALCCSVTTSPTLAILCPLEEWSSSWTKAIATPCRAYRSNERKRRSRRWRAAPCPPASPSHSMARPLGLGKSNTEKRKLHTSQTPCFPCSRFTPFFRYSLLTRRFESKLPVLSCRRSLLLWRQSRHETSVAFLFVHGDPDLHVFSEPHLTCCRSSGTLFVHVPDFVASAPDVFRVDPTRSWISSDLDSFSRSDNTLSARTGGRCQISW